MAPMRCPDRTRAIAALFVLGATIAGCGGGSGTDAAPAEAIPYPLYPDGERYLSGDENGLRVVSFETDDDFAEVDAWYRERRETEAMPRLLAMSDYVRYARDPDDADAWDTRRPGIVIHGFADDAERAAVGADAASRTNIIVSY